MSQSTPYKTVTKCRCCDSENLYNYLDLGNQPLANSYHHGETLPAYPLSVNVCINCNHSQLTIVVPPDDMFRNYLYVSGTTATFRKHCENLANDAVGIARKIKGNNCKSVLDLACNDGTLLGYFRANGCQVHGVDPARNLRAITEKKGIPVEVDYWSTDVANRMPAFDIITGTNVFAHVDDIQGFLNACYVAMHDASILVLEFPYCAKMVAEHEFDTIYHEHLSYFLAKPFVEVTTRCGFKIINIKQTPIHGGSIRFTLQKTTGSVGDRYQTTETVDLLESESMNGLSYIPTYEQFNRHTERLKLEFLALLETERQDRKVIGYGAAAKGNTMLNYSGAKLDYIVDDNELKWGYMTPGSNIMINSPDTLKAEEGPLSIVILAWNFIADIVSNLKKWRPDKHDRCIMYIPEMKVIQL